MDTPPYPFPAVPAQAPRECSLIRACAPFVATFVLGAGVGAAAESSFAEPTAGASPVVTVVYTPTPVPAAATSSPISTPAPPPPPEPEPAVELPPVEVPPERPAGDAEDGEESRAGL